MGIGAALLGAGAISAVGGAVSAGIGSSAATSAANTQLQATREALAQQKATTQQVLGIEQPFVDVGKGAIPAYNELLGIDSSGNFSPTSMSSALAKTPGYQFALDQGLQATQSGFAAQGLDRSGSALKGAAQYAEGLAGTQYQNILGNYYNAIGLGGNAAANFGASAMGGQAAANQLITAGGQASAAGQIGSANAITGGINSITGNIGNTAQVLALTGGGGLFGGTGGSTLPPNALTFAGSGSVFGGG